MSMLREYARIRGIHHRPRIETSDVRTAPTERTRMRFARLGPIGEEIPVVLDGDRVLDLRPVTSDVDGAFLADDGIGRARSALAAGTLRELAGAAQLRTGAPIARPSAVYCI